MGEPSEIPIDNPLSASNIFLGLGALIGLIFAGLFFFWTFVKREATTPCVPDDGTAATTTAPCACGDVICEPGQFCNTSNTTPCSSSASVAPGAGGERGAVSRDRTCADTNADGSNSAFNCAGETNSINASPAGIICAADPCTADECCTVVPLSGGVGVVDQTPSCQSPCAGTSGYQEGSCTFGNYEMTETNLSYDTFDVTATCRLDNTAVPANKCSAPGAEYTPPEGCSGSGSVSRRPTAAELDLNSSGMVDVGDLLLVMASYGRQRLDDEGQVRGDGVVDVTDVLDTLEKYGCSDVDGDGRCH